MRVTTRTCFECIIDLVYFALNLVVVVVVVVITFIKLAERLQQ